TIMRNHAELLKVKFGSALATENKDNEIVCIPGLKGRDPKEISLRNLSQIIQARMEEIIEHVYYEIRNSGFEKQLIGGIVLTGGGSQLKHMKQLVEYITGMDCRIGFPNEHVVKAKNENLLIPAMSTGVGLVIQGLEKFSPSVGATNTESATVTSNTDDKKKKTSVSNKDQQKKDSASLLTRIKEFFDAEEE
ncbi:MAG: cell division FtsA domain-containing protein, partial [Flavobacteriales bacterium]